MTTLAWAHANAELGIVLGVWAHPDDEAYLSAGLMAAARSAGQRVVVVTATAGELGTADADRQGTAQLAHQRRQELVDSLAALDVHEHRLLGVADGACEAVSLEAGAALVGAHLHDVRPDTVVTFGPEGMTGHPDHRAVHRWVTEAWRRAGSPCRLLYATVTPAFHARWGHVNTALDLWQGRAPCTPPDELALEVDCSLMLDRKLAALQAHASQVGPVLDLIGPDDFRAWWATESFVAADDAGGPLPGGTAQTVDLRV